MGLAGQDWLRTLLPTAECGISKGCVLFSGVPGETRLRWRYGTPIRQGRAFENKLGEVVELEPQNLFSTVEMH